MYDSRSRKNMWEGNYAAEGKGALFVWRNSFFRGSNLFPEGIKIYHLATLKVSIFLFIDFAKSHDSLFEGQNFEAIIYFFFVVSLEKL